MSIATRINEMSSHIEQAYDELEGLGADLTNVNKNIKNISMVLDNIYDSMPQVSGEGTSLTLDNTRVGKIKSTLKGNTSQTTYSGKNLLINIRDEGYTVTSNGITFKVNADKSITISGTATGTAAMSLNTNIPVTLSAGTYTLSKGDTNNVQIAIWYDSTSVWTAVSGTTQTAQKTISEDTTFNNWRTLVVVYEGTTINTTIYPMLEKGNVKTSYEPYVGGTTSPNPEFPQPVNVVSGDNEINVIGKNLISFANITNNTLLGITRTINQETITLNGTTTSAGNIVAKTSTGIILKAGTYTGSITTSGSYNRPSGDVAFYLRKNNTVSGMFGISLTNMATDGQYSSSFILTEDTEIFLEIYTNASNITFNNYICKFQIEKGSSATSYKPYQGKTYNIDLRTSKNLFNKDTIIDGKVLASDGSLIDASGYIVGDYIQVKPSTQYTISFDYTAKEYLRIGYYQKDKTFIDRPYSGDGPWTITTPSNCYHIRICTPTNYTNIQCEKGNQQTTYEAYSSIELCKIGTYQDTIVKDNDKWYVKKEIGKVILNGSENWSLGSSSGRYDLIINEAISGSATTNYVLTDRFKQNFSTTNYSIFLSGSYHGIGVVYQDIIWDLSKWKPWLSSHNTTLYYALSTPINIEIINTTLIEQLDALRLASSYTTQTNISQKNNDLPFIIKANALLQISD